MTIKGKLISIFNIIGLILLLLGVFMAWNTVKIYRQVKTVDPSLDALQSIREIRSYLYKQEHVLIHYMVFGEQEARADYVYLAGPIEEEINELIIAVTAKRGRYGKSAAAAYESIKNMQEQYNEFLKAGARCFRANEKGKQGEALRIMTGEIAHHLDAALLPELDRLLHDETEEIYAINHSILMATGALPWAGEMNLREVEVAESSIAYYLAVGKAELALNRVMKELAEYLVSGKREDRIAFANSRVEMEKVFTEWQTAISRQMALGVGGEDQDEKNLRTIMGRYGDVMQLLEKSARIRMSGKPEEALQYFEHKIRFMIDNVLFSTLDAISLDSKSEVEEAHRVLLRTVITAGASGLAVLALLSVLIFIISLRLVGGILSSLGRLKEGTEIIRSGNLDHRIDIPSNDEFGELSASFNRMTETIHDSNEELKSFAYIVSHDLRAPLVNIRGFATELRYSMKVFSDAVNTCLPHLDAGERERLSRAFRKDIPEALGFIESSVARMDGLISAILKLSRMGRSALRQDRIDIKELVQSLLKTVAHQIEEGKVRVTVSELPEVTADRTALEQIMGNLIDNALKYLDHERPGLLEITGEKNAAETVFHIRDNGQGIAREDLRKIFEIFQRAGKQNVPGEGMGLAYVKAMVKRHGGRIWCESVPGVGSAFSFTIPQRRESDERRDWRFAKKGKHQMPNLK